MTIQLDGYNISRTKLVEDLDADISQTLGSVASQTLIESPTSSIYRSSKLSEAMYGELAPEGRGSIKAGTRQMVRQGPTSRIISQADALTRTSEQGVDLKIGENGIPEDALNIMIQRKREELKRRSIINSAPEGFWAGTAQIGTGLATSIADPINVASAFIPFVGQARYAQLLARAGGAAGRTGVRAGVGAIQGAAGAALVEPVVLYAADQEQAEYGLYNSFLNLTFGAVLGGGLHAGLGAVGDVLSRSSAQTRSDLISAAVAQSVEGRPVDIGYIAHADPEFRLVWQEDQIARAMRGESLPDAAGREVQSVIDDLVPTIIERARRDQPESIAARIEEDINSGIVPREFAQEIADAVSARVDSLGASTPDRAQISFEASAQSSLQASESLLNYSSRTAESLDTETSDILTALDDFGEDSAPLRAEIDEINAEADREAAGLREALLCMIGR